MYFIIIDFFFDDKCEYDFIVCKMICSKQVFNGCDYSCYVGFGID